MENIFVAISKLLAKPRLKKLLQTSPAESINLKASMDAIKFHLNDLEKNLEEFCRRNPDSVMCKGKNMSDGK